ncbi:MAG: DEAD/DEAH box helicase [Polyangiales bacterium]
MDAFKVQGQLVGSYLDFVQSFFKIRDERIAYHIAQRLAEGHLTPDALVQLNPAYEPGPSMSELIASGRLHAECARIFADKKPDGSDAVALSFHKHQVEGFDAARARDHYVLTTGTGSGKSLSYIVPIVDDVLRSSKRKGISAVIVYPMNALANSQRNELEKYLVRGYGDRRPVTFERYTGQESDEQRRAIIEHPPDILLTNYVMLELLLTRPHERKLVDAMQGLRFLVLDELHTYRGRQGADVAMLIRRLRETCRASDVVHVGTSATMASAGSWDEQRSAVANVASMLFGVTVRPERVIGETLRRRTTVTTDRISLGEKIRAAIDAGGPPPRTAREFLSHPLTEWLESMVGFDIESGTGRLIRRKPLPLDGDDGIAQLLVDDVQLPLARCREVLHDHLIAGSKCRDDRGRAVLPFRLHQFVSKGENVYATLLDEHHRVSTVFAQRFEPNSGGQQRLLPLVFCRECGQDYYVVRKIADRDGTTRFIARDIGDVGDSDGEPGFLFIRAENPWPTDESAVVERLPDEFIDSDDGRRMLRKDARDLVPREIHVAPDGTIAKDGQRALWIEAPFRFCLECGVSYAGSQRSDFGKLASLGTEGRSTATTVLSMETVRLLRADDAVGVDARKVLSFTDNRQDASLQAGHFNDFVEVTRLRSAIYRALDDAPDEGLSFDKLTSLVFQRLGVAFEQYAAQPEAKYGARKTAENAMREAIGYLLFVDLRRGWRVTSPNLEQVGLLALDYDSFAEIVSDDELWKKQHPILAAAPADLRALAVRAMLDWMRRELAINVQYLDPDRQREMLDRTRALLVAPWNLEDPPKPETSAVVLPRARRPTDQKDRVTYLSPLGGFGRYLRRKLPGANSVKAREFGPVIESMLDAMVEAGLVDRVWDKRNADDVAGYQLAAMQLRWKRGAGTPARDPIRTPSAPDTDPHVNGYFRELYRRDPVVLDKLEAREHTAQVSSDERLLREQRFRDGKLPVMYCSPTMELGVDIADLSVVNLRNVPPTPANYAQRSGRAGRGGQPALVVTYCSSGSPHDQYFFRRPAQMVAGSVDPPRIELANEDLLRAHVHAVWLSCSGLSLGSSLVDLLDVENDELPLRPEVIEVLRNPTIRARARAMAIASMGSVVRERLEVDADAWISRVVEQVEHSFERACVRWRTLYRGAKSESYRQQEIVTSAIRKESERAIAQRLRAEAEAQLKLLIDKNEQNLGDFYSYRYFASEGFLPGYNFPRLPLSAFLPGRRRRSGGDEQVSRPRFLAISEFGPQNIVYHEGARFVVSKVLLPVAEDGAVFEQRAAVCPECGYLHPARGTDDPPALCERCGASLASGTFHNLLRMQDVVARRRDRISSDEEERTRRGYEIHTAVRFAQRDGKPSVRRADVTASSGGSLVRLEYAPAATLWRVNVGWRRRRKDAMAGFNLDIERGQWASGDGAEAEAETPANAKIRRFVPFVEDTRNCLLFEPTAESGLLDELKEGASVKMAGLEAALKRGIQACFQLEDHELASEPLPASGARRRVLFYEASEGGAGVLRRLVEEPGALSRVARRALELCHFDPDTGADLHARMRVNAEGVVQHRCIAGCYECLLSYYNQRDHELLDRRAIRDGLMALARASVASAPGDVSRIEAVQSLLNRCDSELERRFVRELDARGLRLPDDAQVRIGTETRVDFLYREAQAAVFVDGPHHDEGAQREKDRAINEALDDKGYLVIRFHHGADWAEIFAREKSTFGDGKREK